MKVLLDENLPHALRHLLAGHQAFTVAYMGWAGVKNGELLRRAGEAAFDVMITMDDGMSYQQNNQSLPIALCVLSAPSNDIEDLAPLIDRILSILGTLTPRSIVRVP